MSKIRLLLVSFVAVLGMAFAATNASAVTVSNPGLYTVSFPDGGLTFTSAGSTAACAASAPVSVTSTGATLVLDLIIPRNPCNGITITPLNRMTNQITSGGSTGFIDTIAARIGISALGGLVNCLFTGNVVLPLTSGSTAVGAPRGTLTSGCASPFNTATVGGTGGTLSTALTITP